MKMIKYKKCFKCKKDLSKENFYIPASIQVNEKMELTGKIAYACPKHYTILNQAFDKKTI